MNNASIDLLKQLASGIHPGAVAGTPAPAGAVEPGQFADLLKQAQSGALTSHRPITVDNDCGVKLNDDQLARLSLAADKAEVAGIRAAAVFIDGQAIKLDVGSRTVTGPADLTSGVVSGIDGVINLSKGLMDKVEAPPPLPFPSATGPGPSLASLLEKLESTSQAA